MAGFEDIKAELLELHRNLWPERHVAYWRSQPEARLPAGWELPDPGIEPEVLEWDSGTIEWVSMSIETLVDNAGLPVDEDE